MVILRNLIWWWKHQWPRYAIILEVPRPENFTVVLTLDTTLHYLRVIHKLLWQNEADRWYCKCQLYEDFLLYDGKGIPSQISSEWVKFSKCWKQNTTFYHPPKNQWNFVHFFALSSLKIVVETKSKRTWLFELILMGYLTQ